MHLKVFLLSLSLRKIRLSTKTKVYASKQRMCLTSCFQPKFMKIAGINTPIAKKVAVIYVLGIHGSI